jgi:hypothetical protein
MKVEGFAPEIKLRYNFTYNFLVGAATMTRLANEIEDKGKAATEIEQLQHRAFVSGSIMQSVAALESDVWSLLFHGPGHHLGSDGLDKQSKEILNIVAETFEKGLPIMTKLDLILQLTKKKKLDLGIQPMQDLDLVISLRNEITHFKSLWTDELDRKKFFKTLEDKDSTPPTYSPDGRQNFFPHICLTHSRAKWALDTVICFIDYYYKELEIKSPLDGCDRKEITL